MTEPELVLALKEKSETAFKELVSLYQHRVFNTALGLLQHHGDAEDVAQEIFIQVYHSINSFKGQSQLSTWIYRITVTRSLDHLRAKKRKKRSGIIGSLFGSDNQPAYDVTDFNHPGIRLENKEAAALLFGYIRRLPVAQRTVFILNKVEGLSYREIAAITGTSEKAVDALFQRAKQNLRKMINKQE